MNKSGELAQLRDLIATFPDKYTVDRLEEANALARTRFEALDNDTIPELNEHIKSGSFRLTVPNCLTLCKVFHSVLFEKIISINGEFRQKSHPNEGKVYFGGQKRQEIKARFTGSDPKDIENDLEIAFQYLSNENSNKALENALRFYQKFVYTHPFYDGNGRVARLFVNLYLYRYDLYVDWKTLQNKGKFLRKLNKFHETGFDRYFKWWLKVCKKEVYEMSEEDEK